MLRSWSTKPLLDEKYLKNLLERSYYKTPPNGLMHEGFDFRNDQFKTTTGSSHDQKQQDSSLRNIQYKKSPGHWKVNYLEVLT